MFGRPKIPTIKTEWSDSGELKRFQAFAWR
jgi:hypothetical protein